VKHTHLLHNTDSRKLTLCTENLQYYHDNDNAVLYLEVL